MTESEWLSSTSPVGLLNALLGLPEATKDAVVRSPLASDRKLRLFGLACLEIRAVHSEKRAVERLANLIEGEATALEFRASGLSAAANAEGFTRQYAASLASPKNVSRAAMALRDIFGNPFRPLVRVSPQGIYLGIGILAPNAPWRPWHQTWTTRDVHAIAQSMYDNNNFADAPYLADALEDAGCNIEDALYELRGKVRCPKCLGIGTFDQDSDPGHSCWVCGEVGWKAPMCRACSGEGCAQHGQDGACDGSGTVPLVHVRGSWVIDLVLGKE